ncbi:phage holin family protein [Arthrobacter sp. H35-D1]|uniref:phage holin family protein n=1 Tax=Arthrobacter sp. H35-D1 TaxID=3046202 RepID=UPI0024BB4444|nr:phage holin family protein [Arthrobacter sp. H35-D1]MDJ0312034.1 phage holin family protein [Arthrobacter sp. H35-D1]
MKKLMVHVGVQLGSSAVAIILAALILPRFSLGLVGFLTAIVVFTVAQSLLEGVVAKLANKYTPALAGAASLVSTWLALIIATLSFGGIRIHGFFTWILAALLVWAIAGLCSVLAHKYVLEGSKK